MNPNVEDGVDVNPIPIEDKENSEAYDVTKLKSGIKRLNQNTVSPLKTIKTSSFSTPRSESRRKSDLFKSPRAPELMNEIQYWQDKYDEKNKACKELESNLNNYWSRLETLKTQLSTQMPNSPIKDRLVSLLPQSPHSQMNHSLTMIENHDIQTPSLSGTTPSLSKINTIFEPINKNQNKPYIDLSEFDTSSLEDSSEMADSILNPKTSHLSSVPRASILPVNSSLYNIDTSLNDTVLNNVKENLDITKELSKNSYEGINKVYDIVKDIQHQVQDLSKGKVNTKDVDINELPEYIQLLQDYKTLQQDYEDLKLEKEQFEEVIIQLKEALRGCIEENDNISKESSEIQSQYNDEISLRHEFELLYTVLKISYEDLETQKHNLETYNNHLKDVIRNRNTIIKKYKKAKQSSHSSKDKINIDDQPMLNNKILDSTISEQLNNDNDILNRTIDKILNESKSILPRESILLKDQVHSLQFANQLLLQKVSQLTEANKEKLDYFKETVQQLKNQLKEKQDNNTSPISASTFFKDAPLDKVDEDINSSLNNSYSIPKKT